MRTTKTDIKFGCREEQADWSKQPPDYWNWRWRLNRRRGNSSVKTRTARSHRGRNSPSTLMIPYICPPPRGRQILRLESKAADLAMQSRMTDSIGHSMLIKDRPLTKTNIRLVLCSSSTQHVWVSATLTFEEKDGSDENARKHCSEEDTKHNFDQNSSHRLRNVHQIRRRD